jgi:hypothetical protein
MIDMARCLAPTASMSNVKNKFKKSNQRPNLASVFCSYENQRLLNFSFGVILVNSHTNGAHVLKIKHGV